jgi:hypothetical protein
LSKAFKNMVVTCDPAVASIDKFMTIYQNEGFVEEIQDKNSIYDFGVLNAILKEKALPEITVE